jgi:hypothetical protein
MGLFFKNPMIPTPYGGSGALKASGSQKLDAQLGFSRRRVYVDLADRWRKMFSAAST